MMDENSRDDFIMDLDLNQEPSADPPSGLGFGSILNELEAAHDRIEERIRQLEAVTVRARLRRWQQAQNPPETRIDVTELEAAHERIEERIRQLEGTVQTGEDGVALQEGIVERAKSSKRDSSHLVAKALELDTDVKKAIGDGGGFFDCNVCLDMAIEPVLTCCGHLFCWACFYQLPCVYSTAKECPVCKGEVTDANITPIYGNGNYTHVSETESGVKVPPRPQAHRVESLRQQRVNRGISHIPVAEALRRIRMGIGATRERPHQRDLDSVSISSDRTEVSGHVPPSEVLPNTVVGGGRRLRSRQFSRVLSETAASLSSISSALDNPRLFEDLEFYVHERLLERSYGPGTIPVDGGDPSTSNAAVEEPQHRIYNPIDQITIAAPNAPASGRMGVSASDAHLENLGTGPPTYLNSTESYASSSSSRRRNRLSRVSDLDNGSSRAPRRRRMS